MLLVIGAVSWSVSYIMIVKWQRARQRARQRREDEEARRQAEELAIANRKRDALIRISTEMKAMIFEGNQTPGSIVSEVRSIANDGGLTDDEFLNSVCSELQALAKCNWETFLNEPKAVDVYTRFPTDSSIDLQEMDSIFSEFKQKLGILETTLRGEIEVLNPLPREVSFMLEHGEKLIWAEPAEFWEIRTATSMESFGMYNSDIYGDIVISGGTAMSGSVSEQGSFGASGVLNASGTLRGTSIGVTRSTTLVNEENRWQLRDKGWVALTDRCCYFAGIGATFEALKIRYDQVVTLRFTADSMICVENVRGATARRFRTGDGPFLYKIVQTLSPLRSAEQPTPKELTE